MLEPRNGMSDKGEKCLALPTFSRHGKVQVNLTLLIWLNENVPSLPTGVDTKQQNCVRGREGVMSIRAAGLTADKQRIRQRRE